MGKISQFYILTLPGGHFDEKKFFFWLWGENSHNSIDIKASALQLLAFDREPNIG